MLGGGQYANGGNAQFKCHFDMLFAFVGLARSRFIGARKPDSDGGRSDS
jgi:hypothetical protein